MKRIVQDFAKNLQNEKNVLKAYFLEYPKFNEVLLIITRSEKIPFQDRGKIWTEKFPHFSAFKFVVYQISEWEKIEKEETEFLKTLKDFGELIFDKVSKNKLLQIFAVSKKNKKSENFEIKNIVNSKIEKSFSLEMYSKSLRIAGQEDFEVAKILFEKRFFKHTVFLCQQAVEKFLKAKLHFFGIKSFKVHNFTSLIKGLEEFLPEIVSLEKEIEQLESLYLVTRYPPFNYSSKMGESIEITEGRAKKFLDLTQKVFDKLWS
ncbi:MAG: hypothetical protein Fur0024_3730 [Patescibacteria group bacterium]